MKKALVLMVVLLLIPGVTITALAATPNPPSSNFITTLQLALPTALILLAILANRYDQRYALTLFGAALLSAILLSHASFSANLYVPGATQYIEFNITGPTTVYTHQSYTWTIQSGGYTPSWKIINTSTANVVASGSGTTIRWAPPSPGRYAIIATYVQTSNVSIYGYGVLVVDAQNPPSPLGWIEGAIESAIQSIIQSLVQGFGGFGSVIAQVGIVPINQLVYAPLPDTFTTTLFYQIQGIVFGIAGLMIAFSVVYNALQGNYYDIVDLAGDVLYKLGVFALFAGAGLTIYEYAAGWINFLIQQTISTQLNAIAGELFISLITYLGSWVVTNVIPLGFGTALANLDTDVIFFYLLFIALAFLRYAILMATISLIPLAAVTWIFEWTRKISGIIVDLIVGLVMSGVIAGYTLAFLEELGLGIILFLIGPVLIGVDLAVVLFLAFTSLRPQGLVKAFKSK
ncbi:MULTISPECIES: hypothetical protein [Sulfolobaceae]|uniref:Uncharacterized protein n=1 Tax=Sulfolobus tengchongensis TaxID=207809 RepID=Q6H0Y2_9CREN|nr:MULTISPECIES: hypothetical protein [Sulfolobaceae]AAT46512.1 hypothetical protein [Sulfolobus tengchongensis]MCP6728451.1 hypothetical protein [Metallosphaera sedula]